MDEQIDHFKRQYEGLRGYEHAKNSLVEVSFNFTSLSVYRRKLPVCYPPQTFANHLPQALLNALDNLNDSYTQEKLDRQRETHFNRDNQVRTKKLEDELRKVKTETVRLPNDTSTAMAANRYRRNVTLLSWF